MSLGTDKLREIYGWLETATLDVFIGAYLVSEDPVEAWAAVRADARYGTWFPGNMTDDGRPRYQEDDYATAIAGYDEVFINVGIDPSVFRDRYGEFIEGDVTPQELELNRVNPMYDRIVSRSLALRNVYSEYFGVELTDSALLASALSPDLGERILAKQISVAEIGGSGKQHGFDIAKEFSSMLQDQGMDQARADTIFGSAQGLLPVLNVLAQRHGDPDDTFDIEEFVGGVELGDQEQRLRIDRLRAQEDSTFTGGKQVDYALSQKTGGVSGLDEL